MTHPHDQAPAPLTAEVVAEMQRDMAAGTPGPVVIGFRNDGSAWLSIGGVAPGQAHSQGDIFFHTDYSRDVANANRFMRLPDLEAGYLALATQLAEREKELATARAQALRAAKMVNDAVDLSEASDAELTAATARIATLTEAADGMKCWLESALKCKDWIWDTDQYEYAQQSIAVYAALTTDKGAAS